MYFKTILAAGVGLMVFATSCGNNPDSVKQAKEANDSTVKSAEAQNDSTKAALADAKPFDKGDADFAVKAANGSMAEVAMGKLAQKNAASRRVKEYGEMMIKDHGAAGEKLKTLATQKNIQLPTELGADEQKNLTDLQKKAGKDFDKAYLNMMEDDHEKDIKEFRNAIDNCKDQDLHAFAVNSLPVLQKHLDSVKAILGKK